MKDEDAIALIPEGTYSVKIEGFEETFLSIETATPYLPVLIKIYGYHRRVFMVIRDTTMLQMIRASESFWIGRSAKVRVSHHTKDDRILCGFEFTKFH